jgi:ribosomal protein L19E
MNKQADGSGQRQGTAYARTVTEISWIKLRNKLGPHQRISASTAKQRISEMDCLSIPE